MPWTLEVFATIMYVEQSLYAPLDGHYISFNLLSISCLLASSYGSYLWKSFAWTMLKVLFYCSIKGKTESKDLIFCSNLLRFVSQTSSFSIDSL